MGIRLLRLEPMLRDKRPRSRVQLKPLIALLCLLTCAALSVRAQETQVPDSRVRHVVNQDVVEMVRADCYHRIVLSPSFRGSTGYGRKFLDADNG
jgi:hypothetical protein